MSRLSNKGFTLVELIMFIVIGAIFLPYSLVAIAKVMDNYSRPDYYVKARFYADKRMSEITNRTYDKITSAACLNETQGDYKINCAVDLINEKDLSTSLSPNTYYKRITVTVEHISLLDGKYVIYTVVTKRPKKP